MLILPMLKGLIRKGDVEEDEVDNVPVHAECPIIVHQVAKVSKGIIIKTS